MPNPDSAAAASSSANTALTGAAGGAAGTGTAGAVSTPAVAAALPASTPASTASTTAAGVETPKPDAAKAPDAGKAADPAAAPYELKLPEGFKADESFTKFTEFAKASGLKAEAAQQVLDMHASAMKAAVSSVHERVLSELGMKDAAQWPDALKADKEFGGAGYDANLAGARKAIAKFGSPELKAVLEQSGLGNHPELVRAFVRVGKAMAEDSVAGAGASTGNGATRSADPEEMLKRAYPTMYAKPAS
jgi:hypothetical protein